MVNRIPVSVDVAVFKLTDRGLDVLIVKRGISDEPYSNQWALAGGTINEHDVDLESAAHRTLSRRTGTDVPYLEQVCTEGNATRDPRGWSNTTVYFALVGPDFGNDLTHTSETLAWVPVTSQTLNNLAFDHTKLFKLALERLRTKMAYSLLPAYLLPEKFALSQLQNVYERVLETTWNNSSFREQMNKVKEHLEPTGEYKSFGGKPAQLYKLKPGARSAYLNRNLA